MKRKTFMQSIGLGALGTLFAPSAKAAEQDLRTHTSVVFEDNVKKIHMHITKQHRYIRTVYSDGVVMDSVIEHSPGRSGFGTGPKIHDPRRVDDWGGYVLFPKWSRTKVKCTDEENEKVTIETCLKATKEDEVTFIKFTFEEHPDHLAMGCLGGHHNVFLV